MPTIKLFTLGCKVNQYDTQAIREQFLTSGFKEIFNGKKADVYVINTCTVTHKADSESLRLMRRAKRENPKARIVVTGCLTELDEDRIREIDNTCLIVKNIDKDKITSALAGHNAGRRPQAVEGITYFAGHTRAFLKIQDGCNNFCAYCKVPLVRGPSHSRPKKDIIEEAKRLVKNGFKEIVLTGICLGAYGRDLRPKIDIADIIEALDSIDGLLRIRLSSIEAGDINDRLIDRMAGSKKLCRHLHIPIQSGDDEILRRMNRRYTRDDYINLIKKIKAKVPQIAITTDVLVGFPGETQEQFQNTITLVKQILPLKVHIFPYSERKGTAASGKFKQELDDKIMKKRIDYLRDIARDCAIAYKKQFLNKKLDVLIEGPLKDNPDFLTGYTDNYIKVIVKAENNLKNQILYITIQ